MENGPKGHLWDTFISVPVLCVLWLGRGGWCLACNSCPSWIKICPMYECYIGKKEERKSHFNQDISS